MSRKIDYNKQARRKLKAGADKLADAVKVTLGAKGRNVIIEKEYNVPHVTKDGVTVANNIALPDPIENMGASMVREAAGKAANESGDGTTTATVLSQAIINEALQVIDGSKKLPWQRQSNPMDLKRGIDKAVTAIVSKLEDMSEKVSHDNDRIRQIATISANSDEEIGSLIGDAMAKVSTDGIITVQESKSTSTFVDVVSGIRFVNGLLHPMYVNTSKATGNYEDVNLLFIHDKVGTTKEILPIISIALKESSKPLVIIANDFEGEVIATLVENKVKKGFNLIPVKAPAYGELRRGSLEDLAIATGGIMLTQEGNITPENFTSDMFGQADKVVIGKETTTIIGGRGDKTIIENRIKELKSQIDDKTQEWDDKEIKTRISKLTGGAAIIHVGANTDVEMKEKRDRVDDALSATKSAVEEGIIAGGGISLITASDEVNYLKLTNKDQKIGAEILRKALQAPLAQIALNSGLNPSRVIRKVKDLGYPMGYDAKSDDYKDMLSAGIIDPKKVTRVALESAASVASLIFTSEATVSLIKQ